MTYLWIGIAAVAGIAVLVTAFREGKPLRRLALSAVEGLCAVGLINLTGTFSGVALGFSWPVLGAAAILGLPGTVGMLLLRFIMLA